MVRVLIADDHPLFRNALRNLLEAGFDELQIAEAASLDEAKTAIESDPELDLVLLDIFMPGSEGYEGLVALRNLSPATPIIMVSGSVSATAIDKAVKCGAMGFVPKTMPSERMLEGINTVLAGDVFVPTGDELSMADDDQVDAETVERLATLTEAESRVFQLITEGKPNKIIAYELDIKESTVKAHTSAILRKLRVHSRTQAVLMAKDLDLGGKW